jgi:transmembrane sensor
MQQKDIKAILEKIQSGNYTPEEEAIAKYWLHQLNQKEPANLTESELDDVSREMWFNVAQRHQPVNKVKRLWPRIAAAASVLLVLSTGGYFILHKTEGQQTANIYRNDIAPGNNQATLTLANGKKIVLTKGLNGKLAQLGNTSINIQKGVGLNFMAAAGTSPDVESIADNTLTTGKGEQSPYPLILADGTKVWLNAQSSITFPTEFKGPERRVKVTGEAYFEVIHNAGKPFFVSLKGESIEDIGTHFDVYAYGDEPAIKTTLLEGSVKIAANNQIALLKPGQQSIIENGSSRIKVANANLKQAIAWKNGKFMFRSESLEAVMRQISRWYNVNITYKDNIAGKEIWGTVNRYGNVSEVLDMIELTGVAHFEVTGRTIIVTK